MLDVEVISSWAIIRSGPGETAPWFKGDVLTQMWYRLANLEGMKIYCLCAYKKCVCLFIDDNNVIL